MTPYTPATGRPSRCGDPLPPKGCEADALSATEKFVLRQFRGRGWTSAETIAESVSAPGLNVIGIVRALYVKGWLRSTDRDGLDTYSPSPQGQRDSTDDDSQPGREGVVQS